MRCVVQRVARAQVTESGEVLGKIEKGLVVLAAFCDSDDKTTVDFCLEKIINLRIFNDEDGKLNKSLEEVGGKILFISNFTVYAQTQKGRRPDFFKASKAEKGVVLYDYAVESLSKLSIAQFGKFGADMQVELINDGPVTVIVEKENL